MASKVITGTIEDFSDKVIRRQDLPYGCEIRFFKRDESRARRDRLIRRLAINSRSLPRLSDSTNVSVLIDRLKNDILSVKVRNDGLEPRLYAPDDSYVRGNMQIGRVRTMPPKNGPTAPNRAYNLFVELLEASGLEELTIEQGGALYRNLDKLLDDKFDKVLLSKELSINNGSLF